MDDIKRQQEADDEYLERERRSDRFFRKVCPWRYYADWDWDDVNKDISLGRACSDKFESGEWSIHNFLCDLDSIANGIITFDGTTSEV